MLRFFFVRQKTAYELLISDWSSDVCSSDLTARGKEPGSEIARPVFGQDGVDEGLRFRVGCAAQRQGAGAEAQLEQSVAASRLQVIMALGRGAGDQFDVAFIDAKEVISGASRWSDRPAIGKNEPMRPTSSDGRVVGGRGEFRRLYALSKASRVNNKEL